MDLVATARNVIEQLSRCALTKLHELPSGEIQTGPDFDRDLDWLCDWSYSSYIDDDNHLHRFVFVESINESTVVKQLHSWPVIGDIIVANSPMQLHFIAIGTTRGNHRISPWCRAFKSQSVPNLRFQKKSGDALEGSDWREVWFASNPKNTSAFWVDQMTADNLIPSLIHTITVTIPAQHHIDTFYHDVAVLYAAITAVTPTTTPLTLPMSRAACDSPYTCPHQSVCYSTKTDIDATGLYAKLKSGRTSATKETVTQ